LRVYHSQSHHLLTSPSLHPVPRKHACFGSTQSDSPAKCFAKHEPFGGIFVDVGPDNEIRGVAQKDTLTFNYLKSIYYKSHEECLEKYEDESCGTPQKFRQSRFKEYHALTLDRVDLLFRPALMRLADDSGAGYLIVGGNSSLAVHALATVANKDSLQSWTNYIDGLDMSASATAVPNFAAKRFYIVATPRVPAPGSRAASGILLSWKQEAVKPSLIYSPLSRRQIGRTTLPAVVTKDLNVATLNIHRELILNDDVTTGDESTSPIWNQTLPGATPPRALDYCSDGDQLYAVIGSVLYAVAGATGQVLWQYTAPGTIHGTPSGCDLDYDGVKRRIIVADTPSTGRPAVHALAPNGSLLWQTALPHMSNGEPMAPTSDINGRVYIGGGAWLAVLAVTDGAQHFVLETDERAHVRQSPNIGMNGAIILPCQGKTLFYSNNGQLAFGFNYGADVDTKNTAVGPSDTIYAASRDGNVNFLPTHELDASYSWAYNADAPISYGPVALPATGEIVMYTTNQRLQVVSPSDFKNLNRIYADNIASPLLPLGRSVYFVDGGGGLRQLQPPGNSNAQSDWPIANIIDPISRIRSMLPVLGADGETLFFATQEPFLTAIRTEDRAALHRARNHQLAPAYPQGIPLHAPLVANVEQLNIGQNVSGIGSSFTGTVVHLLVYVTDRPPPTLPLPTSGANATAPSGQNSSAPLATPVSNTTAGSANTTTAAPMSSAGALPEGVYLQTFYLVNERDRFELQSHPSLNALPHLAGDAALVSVGSLFASHDNAYVYMVEDQMLDVLRLPSAETAFNISLGVFRFPEPPAYNMDFHWRGSHWLAVVSAQGTLTILHLNGTSIADVWHIAVGPAVAAPVLGRGTEANTLVISLASGTVVGVDLASQAIGFFYDLRVVASLKTGQSFPASERLTAPFINEAGSTFVGFGEYLFDIHPGRPKILLNRRCLVDELVSPPIQLSAAVYLREQPKPIGNLTCSELWRRDFCSGARLQALREEFCAAYSHDLPFSCVRTQRSIKKALSLTYSATSGIYSLLIIVVVFCTASCRRLRTLAGVQSAQDLKEEIFI
jgi:outer membrane protein assembly factor BamB